jgi:hypothetical protein
LSEVSSPSTAATSPINVSASVGLSQIQKDFHVLDTGVLSQNSAVITNPGCIRPHHQSTTIMVSPEFCLGHSSQTIEMPSPPVAATTPTKAPTKKSRQDVQEMLDWMLTRDRIEEKDPDVLRKRLATLSRKDLEDEIVQRVWNSVRCTDEHGLELQKKDQIIKSWEQQLKQAQYEVRAIQSRETFKHQVKLAAAHAKEVSELENQIEQVAERSNQIAKELQNKLEAAEGMRRLCEIDNKKLATAYKDLDDQISQLNRDSLEFPVLRTKIENLQDEKNSLEIEKKIGVEMRKSLEEETRTFQEQVGKLEASLQEARCNIKLGEKATAMRGEKERLLVTRLEETLMKLERVEKKKEKAEEYKAKMRIALEDAARRDKEAVSTQKELQLSLESHDILISRLRGNLEIAWKTRWLLSLTIFVLVAVLISRAGIV